MTENRTPLKPVLRGVVSIALFMTGFDQTQISDSFPWPGALSAFKRPNFSEFLKKYPRSMFWRKKRNLIM